MTDEELMRKIRERENAAGDGRRDLLLGELQAAEVAQSHGRQIIRMPELRKEGTVSMKEPPRPGGHYGGRGDLCEIAHQLSRIADHLQSIIAANDILIPLQIETEKLRIKALNRKLDDPTR